MPLKKRQLSVSPCKNLTPQDMFDSCGNQIEEEDKGSHAAIFEVKFGTRAEGSFPDSRERPADTLFSDLESVALVVEGSDLQDNFVPTAKCIRDTKERQLVSKSGLQRSRCCVRHLHHERATTAPGSVRKFFKRYFNRCTTLRSMSLLEMPMWQHSNFTQSMSTKICTILQLPLC